MKKRGLLKRLIAFVLKNYFISIFAICIVFVGFVSVYKLFIVKPTYVYAKIKVGQGLWWASTAKPNIWYIHAMKKGETEKDLTGKPVAVLEHIRYYQNPFSNPNQYDVYITVKLRVSRIKNSNTYNFKRSTIGISSPIDLEFPSTQISGTIIGLSDKPIVDSFIEKVITLTKKNAYPWEYDAITIGDSYNDGQDDVFQIVDKQSTDTINLGTDTLGNYTPSITEPRKYIVVKVKIKVQENNKQLIFGEEQIVIIGKPLIVQASRFAFSDYIVSAIE